ncbi:MAG: lipid-A-disaccharide synthase [Gemmatimonadaceae bacterium]
MREILFIAGESSGDLHAAGVAAELGSVLPGVPLAGVGGDRMAAAGVQLVERAERLAVMGFFEVLRHVPRHYLLLRKLRRRLESGRVGLLILVDYPGFNMKLAAAAARARVPVLYYITPQVWAWGVGRLEALARMVTRAAVILPFEEELLCRHGVRATFVGHPLLDRAAGMPERAEARRSIGAPSAGPVLALFPGSRAQEIDRHLGDFIAVGLEMQRRVPGLHVVVSVAPAIQLDADVCPFPLVRSGSFAVLRAADAALCKSGTTTLEAAVAGCPLAVAYRTNAMTYAIARRVVKIPHIALVNVVAGREVAREFVQDALRPEPIADVLVSLLDHVSEARRTMLLALEEVTAALGTPGAAARVASMAAELHG